MTSSREYKSCSWEQEEWLGRLTKRLQINIWMHFKWGASKNHNTVGFVYENKSNTKETIKYFDKNKTQIQSHLTSILLPSYPIQSISNDLNVQLINVLFRNAIDEIWGWKTINMELEHYYSASPLLNNWKSPFNSTTSLQQNEFH